MNRSASLCSQAELIVGGRRIYQNRPERGQRLELKRLADDPTEADDGSEHHRYAKHCHQIRIVGIASLSEEFDFANFTGR